MSRKLLETEQDLDELMNAYEETKNEELKRPIFNNVTYLRVVMDLDLCQIREDAVDIYLTMLQQEEFELMGKRVCAIMLQIEDLIGIRHLEE